MAKLPRSPFKRDNWLFASWVGALLPIGWLLACLFDGVAVTDADGVACILVYALILLVYWLWGRDDE